jgi:hypothetical protein
MDKKVKPRRGDAFDLPGYSVVAAAVQPRKQTANLRRPEPINNIIIENAAMGRQSWERRRAMVKARI